MATGNPSKRMVFFGWENHLLQHQKCDVLCCLDPLFLPIKIPMVQKNTECCLYLLVSWMAITFLMSLKYVFFVSSSLFPPEHGSKSLVPRNMQNQSFWHLPSKKKTLIRKPTMCTSFVLGKLWISPKSKLDNLR